MCPVLQHPATRSSGGAHNTFCTAAVTMSGTNDPQKWLELYCDMDIRYHACKYHTARTMSSAPPSDEPPPTVDESPAAIPAGSAEPTALSKSETRPRRVVLVLLLVASAVAITVALSRLTPMRPLTPVAM